METKILRARYPMREGYGDEAEVWVRLENLTIEDAAFNVARMRRDAQDLIKEAEALEKYIGERKP